MSRLRRRLTAAGPLLRLVLAATGCASLSACAALSRGPQFPEQHGPADENWARWLKPAEADQAQPRFEVAESEVVVEPVWEGSTVTFRWEIANTGAAPLRMELWD
ncbi:MAG: hypothetical protein AB1716_00330 [Planctomycetota bacterium]